MDMLIPAITVVAWLGILAVLMLIAYAMVLLIGTLKSYRHPGQAPAPVKPGKDILESTSPEELKRMIRADKGLEDMLGYHQDMGDEGYAG